ncbi:MAG: hypothetical protein V1911_02865 [Candidatus Micrarchaeota archaeon]
MQIGPEEGKASEKRGRQAKMGREDTGVSSERMMADIHTLDSRLRVTAQRMKIIEKNEQIIGKTLITHSKKIRDIEERMMSGMPVSSLPAPAASAPVIHSESLGEPGQSAEDAEDVREILSVLTEEMQKNRELMNSIQEQINEMKYVLDTINPVAYVTAEQVSDLVDEKLRKMKK